MNIQSLKANSLGSGRSLHDDNEEEQDFGPSVRCVLFNLENEVYGVPVKKIREVLRVSHIREVQGASYDVLGVINVRGVIVTVVDTRTILSLSSYEITDFSRIVIVELDEERMVGMLMDNVLEVKDIPENRFEALSAQDSCSRYINGIAHYQNQVIILLDIDAIFANEE